MSEQSVSEEERSEESSGDSEPQDQEQYEVECIYAAEAVPDNPAKPKGDKKTYPGWSYLTKWANYPESDNTWEHQDQFDENTEDLLRRFWLAIGIEGDYSDYPFGHRVHAPQKWIDEEKRRFAEAKEKEKKKLERRLQKRMHRSETLKKETKSKRELSVSKVPHKAVSKASRPAAGAQQLPPPKAPAPQLKTSGKAHLPQQDPKGTSNSAGTASDSDDDIEPQVASTSKVKGKGKGKGRKRVNHREETVEEEVSVSEDEPLPAKAALKRPRVPHAQEEVAPDDEDTAHARRNAIRDRVQDEEVAIGHLKGNKSRHNFLAETALQEKDNPVTVQAADEPAPAKERRTFARPARLWSSSANKSTVTTASAEEPTETGLKQVPVDNEDETMKELFGDSPPASDTDRPPTNAAIPGRSAPIRIPGQKPWKESRIKLFDPTAKDQTGPTVGAAPKPIATKQKILSRLMNPPAVEPTNAANRDEQPVLEDLPDYDEGDYPVPTVPNPPVAAMGTAGADFFADGSHPPMVPQPAMDTGTLLLKIDLAGSDGEQRARSPDSDIVMLDAADRSNMSKFDATSRSGEFLATIWIAGEAITNVKLTQVSALRKFAPKLTFLCRDHRLDVVSYHTSAIAAAMLEQSKVLQTGLLLFEPSRASGTNNDVLFENLLSWLRDLHWAAGAYIEQSNEKKKRMLLLFHSSNLELTRICQVPPWNSKDGIIVAAAELPEDVDWSKDMNVIQGSSATQRAPADPFFLHYIVEKLRIPKHILHDQMRGRPYCVLPTREGSDSFLKEDISNLTQALEYVNASSRLLGEIIDQDTFVFIHRKLLRNLDSEMREITRLRKYPRVFFYCFGLGDPLDNTPITEEEPRLICPRGGIVTLTPKAVMEDPVATVQLVNDLTKKPGWECYVIPAVLAALQEHKDPNNEAHAWALVALILATNKSEDRLVLTESIDRSINRVLARGQHVGQNEGQLRDTIAYLWTVGQFELLEADPEKLLDLCRRVATQSSPSVDIDDVTVSVFEDMLSMQRQPRLLESYRRFIVITSTGREGQAYTDQLDRCTVAEFWSSVKAEFAREQELASMESPAMTHMETDGV